MAEPLEFRALLFDGDDLLDADFRLKNGLTSDLLDLEDQLLMPLLVLLLHVVLSVKILLLYKVVLVEGIVEPSAIWLVADCLVKYFLDELILQRFVIQVNIG